MNLQQKKDNSFLATEPLGKLLLKLSAHSYSPNHQHAVQYCGPYLYWTIPENEHWH